MWMLVNTTIFDTLDNVIQMVDAMDDQLKVTSFFLQKFKNKLKHKLVLRLSAVSTATTTPALLLPLTATVSGRNTRRPGTTLSRYNRS